MSEGLVPWWEDLAGQTTPGTGLRGGIPYSSTPDVNTPCTARGYRDRACGGDGFECWSR